MRSRCPSEYGNGVLPRDSGVGSGWEGLRQPSRESVGWQPLHMRCYAAVPLPRLALGPPTARSCVCGSEWCQEFGAVNESLLRGTEIEGASRIYPSGCRNHHHRSFEVGALDLFRRILETKHRPLMTESQRIVKNLTFIPPTGAQLRSLWLLRVY